MGMSSVVKGEDRKMELWISGQSDIYRSALSDISYICMLENTRCQYIQHSEAGRAKAMSALEICNWVPSFTAWKPKPKRPRKILRLNWERCQGEEIVLVLLCMKMTYIVWRQLSARKTPPQPGLVGSPQQCRLPIVGLGSRKKIVTIVTYKTFSVITNVDVFYPAINLFITIFVRRRCRRPQAQNHLDLAVLTLGGLTRLIIYLLIIIYKGRF